MTNNVITNFFAIINGALLQKKIYCRVPFTQDTFSLATILYAHGYIVEFRVAIKPYVPKEFIWITLKTREGTSPTPLHSITIISSTGNNVYWDLDRVITETIRGKSVRKFVLSTDKGFMLNDTALKRGLGGKVLCQLN